MSDTIAAIATALSPSAIGILRLSGPDTKAVLDAVFFPLNGRPMSQQTPRTMVLGRVLDGHLWCAGGERLRNDGGISSRSRNRLCVSI